MAYHPKPYWNMLLPAMHPNLANISRAWAAKTITTVFLVLSKISLALKVGTMRIGLKVHLHRLYQLYMLIQKSKEKIVGKIIKKITLETNRGEPVILLRDIECGKKISQQPHL